jgi:hypothetical protein
VRIQNVGRAIRVNSGIISAANGTIIDSSKA